MAPSGIGSRRYTRSIRLHIANVIANCAAGLAWQNWTDEIQAKRSLGDTWLWRLWLVYFRDKTGTAPLKGDPAQDYPADMPLGYKEFILLPEEPNDTPAEEPEPADDSSVRHYMSDAPAPVIVPETSTHPT